MGGGGNLSKEMEDIKRTKWKFLEWKNTTVKIKNNSMGGLKPEWRDRGKSSELKEKTSESIRSKQQKEKRLKNNEQCLGAVGLLLKT